MDVIGPIAAHGAVIVPDLPGAGRTRSVDPRAGRAEHGARFLGDLCETLDLDRVVLDRHSMGALVERTLRCTASRAGGAPGADQSGASGPPGSTWRFAWAWRLALRVAPRLARIPMRAGIRCKAAQWRRWRDDPTDPQLTEALARMGTDASRISPALLSLIDEEIERYRAPWRIDGAIQGAVSALAAMTVDEGIGPRRAGADRGPDAGGVGRSGSPHPTPPRSRNSRELHPGWEFRAVDGIGHLLPLEAPQMYVELVADWMGGRTERALGRAAPADGALDR